MSGKPKRGLDFSGWNTDIFENDTKIDRLIDAQGWTGFAIYFYLCQKAYASDGYFYKWGYANAATTARRMGGGIGSEAIKQVVALCLRIGLFDEGLFEGEGVLTSRGIQRRYAQAVVKRAYKVINPAYWLLTDDESKGFVFRVENDDVLPENVYSLPENAPESKVKNSKEYPLAGNARTRATLPPTLQEITAYCKERENRINPQKFYDTYTATGWKYHGSPITDWRSLVRLWETYNFDSNNISAGSTGSFDTEDFFNAALKRTYGDL